MASESHRAEFQVFSLRSQNGRGQDLRAREYRKRKTHLKTKTGCSSCKSKRVKCDETRPICRRCSRNNWKCSFDLNAQEDNSLVVPKNTTYGSPQADLSLVSSSQYAELSERTMLHHDDSIGGKSRAYLLHNYQQLQSEIWGLPNTPQMFDMAVSHPFLLHAMFAVSASHLRYQYSRHPNVVSSGSAGMKIPYRLVEHAQQSLALSSFQEALYRPIADSQTSDSLIVTAMLLNMLTFSFVESEDPRTSWVFASTSRTHTPSYFPPAPDLKRKNENDSDEAQSAIYEKSDPLGWFSIQLGLKPLLIATGAFRSQSILQGMFAASDDGTGAFAGDGLPLDRVPKAWLALCCPVPPTGFSSADASENIFHDPVRILSELRAIPPKREYFFLYMSFFGKLGPDFRDELRGAIEGGSDPSNISHVAALWLLGCWLGMLCRFNNPRFWWLRRRARRDYDAIQLRLRQGSCPVGLDYEVWETLLRDLEEASDWPSCCPQATRGG